MLAMGSGNMWAMLYAEECIPFMGLLRNSLSRPYALCGRRQHLSGRPRTFWQRLPDAQLKDDGGRS